MTIDPATVIRRMGEGARTGQIARRMGYPTQAVRRALLKLEQEGRVRRDERFTYPTDIYWRPSFPAGAGEEV